MQTFDFQNSIFSTRINIPQTAKIIFVADLFANEYIGGAELTTQALIDSSPYEVFKIKSKEITMDLLKDGASKFWIFGNFCELNPQLIPTIVANLKYSVLEYDYKFCKVRSPEKHLQTLGVPCDCHNQVIGKTISAFYYGSMGLWWMSQSQKERYLVAFPFLEDKNNVVLSSIFNKKTLEKIRDLRTQSSKKSRTKWIVLGSSSWIKGADDAEKWCKDNNKDYEIVWNLPYDKLLEKLAVSDGFVYLPKGGDTCPRMVIEAKLLGCKMHLNDNVQHANEDWFNTNDIESIELYLSLAPEIFWNGIKNMIEYRPTISGYSTTYNAIKQQYPFEQCIESMLQFCDEVCVVDGGSSDGTWEVLQRLAAENVTQDSVKEGPKCKLKIKQIKRDWSSKRHSVFDGMQKAEARKLCTKDYCWQMDSDEIVHESDVTKIADMCRAIPKGVDILALPVVEYWGSEDKVRMDIQPWKWRLSRNLPHITHGIPREVRAYDSNGDLYATGGTDGCDMIHNETFERLPHVSFYTQEVENVRLAAMLGNEQARKDYESWFNQVVTGIPGVFHYSWYDLPRKIKLYRDYWQSHWAGLWDKDESDIPENNMMFSIPWKDVTDEMIIARASEMKEKLGGWIWHRPWDGKTTTPHIKCIKTQPKLMKK